MKTYITAERAMDASAEAIYHCVVDYREHHNPDGFLPPAFSDLEVLRGGVGSGTEYRVAMTLGGRRREMTATVEETVPGREVVERAPGIRTTFTVEPTERGSQVRFETVMEANGLEGLGNRLFAGRLLKPVYEDELRRLEAYARAHPAAPSLAASPPAPSSSIPAAIGEGGL
jgi:Polyketide cyclase / dehydrase and lipid transport